MAWSCAAIAVVVACTVHHSDATTLLFLDDHPLNLKVNVRRVTATPETMKNSWFT